MRKIKVLEVTTSYPRFRGDYPGIFNFRLDRELVDAGLEIQVLAPAAPGYPEEETIDGVNVRRVNYFWPRRFQLLAYGTGIKANIQAAPWIALQIPLLFASFFVNILRFGRRADIVHCHWAPTGLVGLLARPFIKKPVVLTLGGTDYRNMPVIVWKYIVKHVDVVVSVATETEKYLEKIGFSDYRTIRTPIDEDEFNPLIEYGKVRAELGIGKRRIILFCGRMYNFKGPQFLVEAAPLVLERRHDVCFVLVGDGKTLPELRGRAKDRGLEKGVIFTGARTDVAKFLKEAAIFTALSPVENTWSNSIAEAMFMEVPMILTDAGYTAEFFKDGQSCVLVPPNDPKRLADEICRLLDDPELCNRIVAGSRRLLDESGKRKSIILANIKALYESVVKA